MLLMILSSATSTTTMVSGVDWLLVYLMLIVMIVRHSHQSSLKLWTLTEDVVLDDGWIGE